MKKLILTAVMVLFSSNAYTSPCFSLGVTEEQITTRLAECQSKAEQGEVSSQIALGKLYCQGFGTILEKDKKKCIGWFRQAKMSISGNAYAQFIYDFGVILMRSEDEGERLEGWELLKNLAIKGHIESCQHEFCDTHVFSNAYRYVHDEMYHHVERITSDDMLDPVLQEYVKFLTDVASVNDQHGYRRDAQMLLSGHYASGHGVISNFPKARYWMSLAGAKGGKYAIAYMKMVKLGYGAQPDHQLAEKLFNEFFEQELKANPQFETCNVLNRLAGFGFSSAMYQLSKAYRKGQHGNCKVDIDDNKAKTWRDLADQAKIVEHKRGH